MIGPKKTPREFGLRPTEHHLVINDINETCKIFRGDGTLIREIPALARGQYGDRTYNITGSDTPPGLYRVGVVYRDYENPLAVDWRTKRAYGWYSLDLDELENQERRYGRAGIMIHGGGSALGDRAWDPYQSLLPTLGCVRMHNAHLRDFVVPLLKSGRIFVSVYQES